MRRRCARWLLSGLFCLSFACHAQAADPGKPLTLDEALAAADAPHPELRAAEAQRDAASADARLADTVQDLSVALEGRLAGGDPTVGDDGFTADNSVRLTARKNLYDFGRSSAARQAAQFELQARQSQLLDVRQQRRIEIMSRFFDVLLADLQFAADDELMAIAYVNFDHARDRLETGQISRVDLAELEARYQDQRVKREASDQRRRITRALLANAMNRPGDLPDALEDPKLSGNDRPLPEYEALIPVMLAENPRLRAQRDLLAAEQGRLESIRAETRPLLDAEAEAGDYSRASSTRNRLSAGVILSWPLYRGGRVDARLAREQAQFQRLQAGVAKLKMDLTQALLETYLDIQRLRQVARQAAKKQAYYRDLALEKARGQYEVELKTDLGDSMAKTVEATLRQRRTEYRLALAIARLEALAGEPLGETAGGDGTDQSGHARSARPGAGGEAAP